MLHNTPINSFKDNKSVVRKKYFGKFKFKDGKLIVTRTDLGTQQTSLNSHTCQSFYRHMAPQKLLKPWKPILKKTSIGNFFAAMHNF